MAHGGEAAGAAGAREGRENNTYKVVVRTSDIRGAGTDSNITLCMFGSRDGKSIDSGTLKLDDSKVRK